MNNFTYTVIVTAETREHADEVMVERIDFEDDLGFEHEIAWRIADDPLAPKHDPDAPVGVAHCTCVDEPGEDPLCPIHGNPQGPDGTN